jgi:hypothetical protein
VQEVRHSPNTAHTIQYIFTLSLSLNYIAITFHNILVGALVTTGLLGNVVNVLVSKQTHKTAIRQKATG